MTLSEKRFVLAKYVRAGISGDVLCFGFGSIQTRIEDPDLQSSVLMAADFLLQPRTLAEVFFFLTNDKEVPALLATEAINLLQSGNYLMASGSYDRHDRYSRHALYYALNGEDPADLQESLQKSHVAVVGCGGIGNQVSVSLATAGIGRLTLIDNDQIEISNLTRQILFTENDLGKSKTETLRKALALRASGITIDAIDTKLFTDQDFAKIPDCDLIVLSADSPGITRRVNDYAIARGIPFVNVGYVNDIAIWGPFVIPGETGCLACRQHNAKSEAASALKNTLLGNINANYQAPSIGPINMLASALACVDIIKFLGGFGEIKSLNKRVGYWTHSGSFEYQDYARNTECQVCG
ncbi:MAG: ThiF family adenylyltransferase [Planctomycetota bacterium]|nr:ThiF family adenylyltransferase [Planctomycetota bacterium]